LSGARLSSHERISGVCVSTSAPATLHNSSSLSSSRSSDSPHPLAELPAEVPETSECTDVRASFCETVCIGVRMTFQGLYARRCERSLGGEGEEEKGCLSSNRRKTQVSVCGAVNLIRSYAASAMC
jgi:hypothetical protein